MPSDPFATAVDLSVARAAVPVAVSDDPFERSLVAFDTQHIQNVRALRATEARMHHLVRRGPGEAFPWHQPWQGLEAALSAVGRVAMNEEPPGFTCLSGQGLAAALDAVGRVAMTDDSHGLTQESDPQRIYDWVVQTMKTFGEEMRDHGMQIERHRIGLHHFTPSQRLATLECINNLNELLTNHRAAARDS